MQQAGWLLGYRWARAGTGRVCGARLGRKGALLVLGSHGGPSRKKTRAEGEAGTGSPSCRQGTAGARPDGHQARRPEEGFSRAPALPPQLTGPEQGAPPPSLRGSVKGVRTPAASQGAGRARGDWASKQHRELGLSSRTLFLTLSASSPGRSKPFHKVPPRPPFIRCPPSPASCPHQLRSLQTRAGPLPPPCTPRDLGLCTCPPSQPTPLGSVPSAHRCLLCHKAHTQIT